jgi:predicted Zn-ribbon and HTH transcriptional regulator
VTEWLKTLINLLTNVNYPIDLADIKRVVEIPMNDPDDEFLFDAIYKIGQRVEEAGMELVIEEGHCVSCGRTNYFSSGFSYTCTHCNQKTVTPPKFCINRKEIF